MQDWWNTLDLRSRVALLAAAGAIVLVIGIGGWWLTRAQQAALFSDLGPQDAAVITGELEKLKVPYTLQDRGATVLVDAAQVHALRLKLMQKDLPLHGAVGFEMFNNADIGMTEFAQTINYQRALQGELTRTILSFPEIREARVHLALPEQSLFRQASTRPKAAITLAMRSGQALRPEQVRGIQRLVAAAVPGLVTQEVTIVDQQGVALSRPGDDDAAADSDARLRLKRETENYLSHKAGLVLEGAFGPGQALASVDVTLDMDRLRITTEDVLAAPDAKAGSSAGVLVRERESSRDGGVPDTRTGDARATPGSSMQRDTEYQAGRRVEQVVNQPGAIRRLQVVALVRQALADAQREELRRLVGAAVGAVPERGDGVVVQAMAAVPAGSGAAVETQAPAWRPSESGPPPSFGVAAAIGLLVLLAVLVILLAASRSRRRAKALLALAPGERQRALEQVQAWILEATPPLAASDLASAQGVRP